MRTHPEYAPGALPFMVSPGPLLSELALITVLLIPTAGEHDHVAVVEGVSESVSYLSGVTLVNNHMDVLGRTLL